MSIQRFPANDPREWLIHARSDLAAGRHIAPGVLQEVGCFHAQQAIEKSIKAIFVALEVDFPYTHDLSHLIGMLGQFGIEFPDEFEGADYLTQYAVETRYPIDDEPITEGERLRTVELAERVVTWAEATILNLPNRGSD